MSPEAGDGDRTRIIGLEGQGSTIKPRPRLRQHYTITRHIGNARLGQWQGRRGDLRQESELLQRVTS
jgi:hypothetical protein